MNRPQSFSVLKFIRRKNSFVGCKLLEELHQQQCAYHGGALLGNDVHTILQAKNFHLLLEALKPKKIKLSSGATKKFGDLQFYPKAVTPFNKISIIYQLATANRALCRHEVALLKVCCYSLGIFFPVNFPLESAKPKLHVLAHHFWQKAEMCGSIGLETEQLIKGLHPFINRRSRQFCTVRDLTRQMALVAQSQWVASGSTSHVPSGRQ